MYSISKLGFSLIELLVAMFLGSIIIMAVGSMLTSSRAMINQLDLQQQLDTELNVLADRISKDLRRAGFFEHSKTKESQSNADFFSIHDVSWGIAGKPYFKNYVSLSRKINNPSEINNSCVIFIYDINMDGCIGLKNGSGSCYTVNENQTKHALGEIFGYRKNGHSIEVTNNSMKNASSEPVSGCIRPGSTLPAGKTYCDSELTTGSLCNSSKGNWEKLTDEQFFKVETFTIEPETQASEVVGSGQKAMLYPRYWLTLKVSLVNNPLVTREIKQIIALENPLR